MFKVGDKVRFTERYGGYPAGTTGVVTRIAPSLSHTLSRRLVHWDVDEQRPSCICFDFRLELVNEGSSMSDQELADKYRRMQDDRAAVVDELMNRGYQVFSKKSGQVLPRLLGEDIKITKTETINL